jgi:histidine ammonia-lyase
VLEQAHALLRERVPAMATDRFIAPDIEQATRLVNNGALAKLLRTLPELPALWNPA